MTYLEQLFAGTQAGNLIDDTATTTDKAWSSSKVSAQFAGLSSVYAELNASVSFSAIALGGIDLAATLAAKEPTIAPGTATQYFRGDKTWQTLDKNAVGLGSADNTSDVDKPVSTAQAAAIALKVNSSSVGAANGVASLDASGLVPAGQLPSYVDDVLEYANLAAFPATGVAGKIYVTLDTNKTYRWSGSTYVNIAASPGSTDVITEGTANLYFTTARVLATVATGLADTAGTPAAADTIITVLGKVKKGFFTDHAGAGGAVHAAVVAGGANGFMLGTDKTKLDGIATGATANATDAALRDRSTHTGTQAPATIAASTGAVLFGRYSGTAGAGQEIIIGSGLLLSGNTLTAPGGGGGGGGLTDADYGDVLVGGAGTTMTVQSAAGDFAVGGNQTITGSLTVGTTNIMTKLGTKLTIVDDTTLYARMVKGGFVLDPNGTGNWRTWFGADTPYGNVGGGDDAGTTYWQLGYVSANDRFRLESHNKAWEFDLPPYVGTEPIWYGSDPSFGTYSKMINPVLPTGSGAAEAGIGTAPTNAAGQLGYAFLTVHDDSRPVMGLWSGDWSIGTTIKAFANANSRFDIVSTNAWEFQLAPYVGTNVMWHAGNFTPSSKLDTANFTFANLGTKPTSLAGYGITDAVASSLLGANNGVATLDSGGKVPAAQLPSYVDDVLEYANLAAFPATGTAGIIYVADDTNKTYRWSGSAYVNIAASPGSTDVITEGSTNLYFTTARVLATAAAGLTDTAGTPAAADTVLTILGKVKKGFFTDHSGAGGAVHANVVAAGAAGFMTGADKTKLDGIATGATANSTDATLLNRANHTGSQAISTVTNLQTTLDAKAPAFTSVLSISASATLADATHNNAYLTLTGGTALTITANATPTAGFTCVIVNRGTVAMTIVCASGYYKNGAAATATTNLSLAPGGRMTAFHEGSGIWTFDGTGF